jgi:hypothetical protein
MMGKKSEKKRGRPVTRKNVLEKAATNSTFKSRESLNSFRASGSDVT